MDNNLSKPLCALTIGEYIELHKELFKEQLEVLGLYKEEVTLEKPEDDIIFLEEVMAITKYKKPTIYSKYQNSRFQFYLVKNL